MGAQEDLVFKTGIVIYYSKIAYMSCHERTHAHRTPKSMTGTSLLILAIVMKSFAPGFMFYILFLVDKSLHVNVHV